jgi:hypothetical protein
LTIDQKTREVVGSIPEPTALRRIEIQLLPRCDTRHKCRKRVFRSSGHPRQRLCQAGSAGKASGPSALRIP